MSKKERMSEEKARRITVGATVGGVLLIVFLVVILIIQFVQMGVKSSRATELDEEIKRYEELIKADEDTLDWIESGNGLYLMARQRGWGGKK